MSNWKSEAQFQSECVKWFDRAYPDRRGRLFMVYNNPPNKVVAGLLVSMGLRRGTADLVYIYGVGRIAFIELKISGGVQSDAQHDFEKMIVQSGFDYYLITESLIEFQTLINKL